MTDWLWGGEGGEERAAGFLAGVRWCMEIGRFQERGVVWHISTVR